MPGLWFEQNLQINYDPIPCIFYFVLGINLVINIVCIVYKPGFGHQKPTFSIGKRRASLDCQVFRLFEKFPTMEKNKNASLLLVLTVVLIIFRRLLRTSSTAKDKQSKDHDQCIPPPPYISSPPLPPPPRLQSLEDAGRGRVMHPEVINAGAFNTYLFFFIVLIHIGQCERQRQNKKQDRWTSLVQQGRS